MPADDTDFDFSSDRGNNPRLLEIIRLDQRRDEARRAEMSTAIGLKGPIWDELAELDGVVRYDRPHLGVLRSAIYYLWKYLPRHMGSPDRFSTYYVMGLTVGVDTDRLGPNDPQRKFIRRMSVEQCLALARHCWKTLAGTLRASIRWLCSTGADRMSRKRWSWPD